MKKSWEIYDLLIESADSNQTLKQVMLGLTWTLCESDGIGLAIGPGYSRRTLSWSGSLKNRKSRDLTAWLRSWDPFEASIGLASVNSILNQDNALLKNATPIIANGTGNLAVFEHFMPYLATKKVVIVGRYPGIEKYAAMENITVLERELQTGDLPDPACEYILPEADWVFLTGSSLANKTFPRLAELSRGAVTVLMGPSVPWFSEFSEFDIDFLAGVKVTDPPALSTTVAEGGGVRIFDDAVQYCVADLGQSLMQGIKTGISDLVIKREKLKVKMDDWYSRPGQGRFPLMTELERVDNELSTFDLRFKRQWDARYQRRSA